MTGTSGTRSGGLRKGQSPCELLAGLSGFLSRQSRGLRPCEESVPEPEDSSPVLTWILGYFWSLPSGVSPRLEWGHESALSSRAVAHCRASLRLDKVICGFSSRLSQEAFPRGFPTGLSHVPPWCESILGLKVEAVQGKQDSLEWTDIWGTLGMVARPWSSSGLSCRERLHLRCDGNAGNSFPITQGKDPSSRARRRKGGSSECARDSRASSRVETGMSGNFLSCSKGVKDPLEVPDVRCV